MPDEALRAALVDAQRLGFVGPGDIDTTLHHAASYAAWCASGGRVLDLGSGGGVPGLVLAVHEPTWSVVLLEGSERRASFLERVVRRLALTDRVTVWAGRVEVLAHEAARRQSCDTVVARGFGPLAVTLECAAPFVRPAGRVVVSAAEVVPVDPAPFGLAEARVDAPGFRVFDQLTACPAVYPRRSVARRGS